MSEKNHDIRRDGKLLVQAVREATRRHATSWQALVPNAVEINRAAESAEDVAYADMATAKQALRDHILTVYGISMQELSSLASS